MRRDRDASARGLWDVKHTVQKREWPEKEGSQISVTVNRLLQKFSKILFATETSQAHDTYEKLSIILWCTLFKSLKIHRQKSIH